MIYLGRQSKQEKKLKQVRLQENKFLHSKENNKKTQSIEHRMISTNDARCAKYIRNLHNLTPKNKHSDERMGRGPQQIFL